MTGTLVVVGHGVVGHRLVARVRAADPTGRWRIVLVSEERRPAYDRTRLSSRLDEGAPGILLDEHDVVGDPVIDLRPGRSVVRLEPDRYRVLLDDGSGVDYRALVLVTGARAFVPPVPGRDAVGCFVYRTVDDLDAIRAAAIPGRTAVVVGGGVLGLEAAEATRLLGMRPLVVETAPFPMPRQLDAPAGRVVSTLLARRGITLYCGTGVESIVTDPSGRAAGVRLTDGAASEAAVVVFAAGIRPRDELGGPDGPVLGERGGFLTDELCRSVSTPDVWAVGDCAAVRGRCYGLVTPGRRMAESVAAQLTGSEPAPFEPPDDVVTLKLAGVPVAGLGDVHARTPGAVEIAATGPGRHAKLVLGRDCRTLLGAVLAGETEAYPALLRSLGGPLAVPPDRLLAPARPGGSGQDVGIRHGPAA